MEKTLKELTTEELVKDKWMLNTAWGKMRVTSINKETWWVNCKEENAGYGRSFSCTPQETLERM